MPLLWALSRVGGAAGPCGLPAAGGLGRACRPAQAAQAPAAPRVPLRIPLRESSWGKKRCDFPSAWSTALAKGGSRRRSGNSQPDTVARSCAQARSAAPCRSPARTRRPRPAPTADPPHLPPHVRTPAGLEDSGRRVSVSWSRVCTHLPPVLFP